MAPAYEVDHVDLLRDISETFLQMANISRINEPDQEIRSFHSHLASNCIRLRAFLEASALLESETASRILGLFGLVILKTDLNELLSHIETTEGRIDVLNRNWQHMQEQSNGATLGLVQRWMRLKIGKEELRSFDKELTHCVDEITKRQPTQKVTEIKVDLRLSNIRKPSFSVWKAASSIFDALIECKQCSCSQPHDFGAKLELGTYRKTHAKHRARKRRWREEADEGIDFDMYLSMERHWHEVRIHTVKPCVKFTPPGNSDSLLGRTFLKSNPKIEALCVPIKQLKQRPLRLELRLTDNQLCNMGFEKTNFRIDNNVGAISLAECLENCHEWFTEKIKRILSVLIGYAVLHLENTPWLQSGWGSTNIKFFQTPSRKVPLRPFIEIQLDCGDSVDDGACNALNVGDLDFAHPCPALISLAVVLMEVYFAKPFNRLAELSGIELIQNPDKRISSIDAYQVFNGDPEEDKKGWRDQIPEDFVYLLTAIDNCLNDELFEHEDGRTLKPDELRLRIYEKVIRPLEIHLTYGFSKIPLEDVDSHARAIDFGQWGQLIPNRQPEDRDFPTLPDTATPLGTPSPANMLHIGSTLSQLESRQTTIGNGKQIHEYPFVSYSPNGLNHPSSFDSSIYAAKFFDDEIGSVVESKRYDEWKSEYMDVYNKFISEHTQTPSSRVKVAILDTGIDDNHPSFDAHGDLKGKLNCFDESRKNKVPDGHGHGTFAANLILDFGQEIDLYIIKISGKENLRPDAKVVRKAIDHAVDVWQVDIISMSFGWPSSKFDGYEDLEDTIHKAHGKDVLMLAAASNSGGHLGRAYPSSSPYVICVHSTDTFGNRSKFSPSPVSDSVNIATVGESILSAWPTFLCDMPEKECRVSRSGTSYSTPILVGIVSFLLQFARVHLTEIESRAIKRKHLMEYVLKKCAQRGLNYTSRDGYSHVALSLHEHTLFGQELEQVKGTISQALRQ